MRLQAVNSGVRFGFTRFNPQTRTITIEMKDPDTFGDFKAPNVSVYSHDRGKESALHTLLKVHQRGERKTWTELFNAAQAAIKHHSPPVF